MTVPDIADQSRHGLRPAGGTLRWTVSEHYFASSPRTASQPGAVDVVLPDVHLRLTTDSGVFSAERVDPGTRVLLEAAPAPPPTGNLLDLGCGYGPIALVLASRAPQATVWAIDVNKRALALCAENANRAGLANVHPREPDQVRPGARFAAIWTNPPARIGKPALQELLATWLDRLCPGGLAYLVLHKHLGSDSLQRWLDTRGWPTSRRASRSCYRVLEIGARS